MGGGGRSGCSAHARPPTAIPSGSRSSAPAHSLHTGAASRRVPRAGPDPHQGTHETMGWGRGRGRKAPTDRRGEGAPGLTVLVPGCPWAWSSSPNPLLCSALSLPRSRISGCSHRGRMVALDPRGNSLRAKAVRWRRGRAAWRALAQHPRAGWPAEAGVSLWPGALCPPHLTRHAGLSTPSPRDRQLTGKVDQICKAP